MTTMNQTTRLRRALLLDAAACGSMGVLLALAAGRLERLFGLPAILLRWCGILLVPFAVLLVWAARLAVTPRAPLVARTVVTGNLLWVIASVLLLARGEVRPTPLGELFVVLQAAAVLVLSYLEHDGARRHLPRP